MITDWSNKRVTVMGLGRFGGGVGVSRWLAEQGARVLVTDLAQPDDLSESIATLDGLPIEWRLGEHREADFRDTDLVVVSPAVPESSPFVAVARDADVPLTTEINLFVQRCPSRTVGITGTVGKSTTTAMLGHILERTWSRGRVVVGGNIGASLLGELSQLTESDVVVLELSSFQLQRTPLVRWSPHVAVVTNVSPNHIDWHGSFAAYLAAKLSIVRFQDPNRDSIIAGDTPELRRHFDLLFGDNAGVWRFSLQGSEPTAVCQTASAVDTDDVRLTFPGLRLTAPGEHNRLNAAVALTTAYVLGIEPEQATAALADFAGLPDRLEFVGEFAGVAYYNDSKASTPEAACIAMRAFDRPICVILGGYDKGADLSPAARLAAEKAKFAACVGKTGERICATVRESGGQSEYFASFDDGVQACIARAEAGDVVLLSPACASWDQFADYRRRGERFKQLVQQSVGCEA